MRTTIAGAALVALLALLLPAPGGVRADAPTDVSARARGVLTQVQAGKLDRSALDPLLDGVLTRPVVATMTAQLAPYGTPKTFVENSKTDLDGVTTYVFRVTWPAATVDYVFGLDDATAKIAKLYFRAGPPPTTASP